MESKYPRILWSSVSPFLKTGYSKVTRNIATRLKARGVDIILHGYQNKGTIQKFENLTVLPNGEQQYGRDVLKPYFEKYNRELLITLYDIWTLDFIPELHIPWSPYFPIDAAPVTAPLTRTLQYAMNPACFSKFAQDELNKVGIQSSIIPHGVDTKLFHPLKRKEQIQAKKSLGLKESDFLIGSVCFNLFDRKDIPGMIKAFSLFLKKTGAKNAYLFFLSDKTFKSGASYSIEALAQLYGVSGKVLYPTTSPFSDPISEEALIKLYNSFDIYLSLSRAEGWNLPLLEAAACGVPGIFTDYSAPPSWYPEKGGWRVPVITKIVSLTTPLHNEWALADLDYSSDLLADIYSNRQLIKEKGERARAGVLKYDWDFVIDNYWLPFLESIKKNLTQPYDAEYFKTRESNLDKGEYNSLLEEIRGDSVLELGSGNGDFVRLLKSKGKRAEGCDVSEVAEKLSKDLKFKRVDVQEKLPYPDESFSTVCSMHLLEHCRDDVAVVKESLRVAKKRAVHMIPLGNRRDWTHKRTYFHSDVMMSLMPSKLITLLNGDAIAIFEKADYSIQGR